MTGKDLKSLHNSAGTYCCGKKAVLLQELLQFLGLQVPTRTPARLILSGIKEKKEYNTYLEEIGSEVEQLECFKDWADAEEEWFGAPWHVFAIRKGCISQGINDTNALERAAGIQSLVTLLLNHGPSLTDFLDFELFVCTVKSCTASCSSTSKIAPQGQSL